MQLRDQPWQISKNKRAASGYGAADTRSRQPMVKDSAQGTPASDQKRSSPASPASSRLPHQVLKREGSGSALEAP